MVYAIDSHDRSTGTCAVLKFKKMVENFLKIICALFLSPLVCQLMMSKIIGGCHKQRIISSDAGH